MTMQSKPYCFAFHCFSQFTILQEHRTLQMKHTVFSKRLYNFLNSSQRTTGNQPIRFFLKGWIQKWRQATTDHLPSRDGVLQPTSRHWHIHLWYVRRGPQRNPLLKPHNRSHHHCLAPQMLNLPPSTDSHSTPTSPESHAMSHIKGAIRQPPQTTEIRPMGLLLNPIPAFPTATTTH